MIKVNLKITDYIILKNRPILLLPEYKYSLTSFVLLAIINFIA